MPSRRMVAVSSASLLFLTVASFAYLDPEATLDVVTMAVPEAKAPNSQVADIQPGSANVDPNASGVLVASAGKFEISDGEPEVLKDAPMARLAVETIVPQNVSVIEKSPEVVESVTTQQQLADLVAEARLAKTLIKPAVSGTRQLTLEARSNDQTSGLAFAPRSREIADSAGRFLAVDNVKRAKETRKPAMVLRQASFVVNRVENKPQARTGKPVVPSLTASEKRDEYTVQQAMLNAKGLNTLTGAQQEELVPKLVGGECVASALKSVAGRVSPILMRDLLTNLNSDC